MLVGRYQWVIIIFWLKWTITSAQLSKHVISRFWYYWDQTLLHSILLPYFNEQIIELEDENLDYQDILHLEVKQTLLPIKDLIEEEQKLLPSDTDVTITAYEIFNDRELSQDVTTVIMDILEAVKLDQPPIEL